MTRVSMVDPSDGDPRVEVLFEAVTAMLGRVPNSYRVLARTPVVAQYLAPFNAVLQREGAGSLLPAKIKEMAVIKTSQTNGCAY